MNAFSLSSLAFRDKIESMVSNLQADVNSIKLELSTTAGAIQQTINLQEERLDAVEDSSTKTSKVMTELEVTVMTLKSEVQARRPREQVEEEQPKDHRHC